MKTTYKIYKIYSAKIILVLISFLIGLNSSSFAQESSQTTENQKLLSSAPGNTKMFIGGTGSVDFFVHSQEDVTTAKFSSIGFSPIFLWKLSDRLFFESEVEIAIDNGETGIDLEYAKFSYILNDYITIGVGRMLTPFGTYLERLHPTFIERFPNAPMMIHHMDGMQAIGPNGAEFGLDLRGGFQLGDSKMNYALYVSNGPVLNDGSTEPMMAGTLEYENFYDNNPNKAIGGRIGFLPFSNSSLEIGVSGNTGKVGNVKSIYENISANAFAVDLSFVKSIPSIESIINIKGQFNTVTTDKASYLNPMDSTMYSFENKSSVFYLQLGFRPILMDDDFLKNLELVFRYNSVTLPKEALWGGGSSSRVDFGLCYWLSWRSGLRLAYEIQKNPSGDDVKELLVRFASGF